ncbi:hypothetical protein IFM46972_09748 [Aspergillus udagawae]|uniref:Uncharacterized protein n=1 Tax=Aspergillus udagawae TaxID=91492 RepID=A0A8H3XLS9_9EURO|nr:hypothetical protein IFM46972_09748 [Aspergillus udagawae]
MPRSRVPQVPAFIHLAIRLGGLALSIACFYYLLYLATHWGEKHTFYFAIFSISAAIVVDLIEVCGLLDASFTLKRLHVGWLIFGNVISIILGVIGCLQVVFGDWSLGDAPSDYPHPWRDTLDQTFMLMIAFPVSRLLFAILECVICGRIRRRQREKRGKEGEGTALPSRSPVTVGAKETPNDA